MRSTAFSRSLYPVSVFAALLLLIPCLVFADDGGDASQRENSLQPGSWALQFQIEDQFSIKALNGFMVALKRHLSKNTALRIGFDLILDFNDRDVEQDGFRADTLYLVDDIAYDQNMQYIELDFLYVKYPNPDASINLFWGAGPLAGFTRQKIEDVRNVEYEGNPSIRTDEQYSRSWSAGARGLVGAEWFATRTISFHAEYRASFRFQHTKIKHSTVNDQRVGLDTKSETEEIRKNWRFEGTNVLVGVSLYF